MNRNQMVTAAARRLRGFRKRDVNEVLSVLLDIWQAELLQPGGYIHLDGLGKLYVEQQEIRSTGVVRAAFARKQRPAPDKLTRYYVRFRPADTFHTNLVAHREPDKEQP